MREKPPALIVHMAEDIAAAREVIARAGLSATLATAPNAASYYGAPMMEHWQKTAKDIPLLIGCGNDVATATVLMQSGVRQLYVNVDKVMFCKLNTIAAMKNVTLVEDYPSRIVDMRHDGWEERVTQ